MQQSLPGSHNFYCGEALTNCNAETKQAVAVLKGGIDANAIMSSGKHTGFMGKVLAN